MEKLKILDTGMSQRRLSCAWSSLRTKPGGSQLNPSTWFEDQMFQSVCLIFLGRQSATSKPYLSTLSTMVRHQESRNGCLGI